MTSVLNTALAGMARNQRGVEVVANNIANVNTDEFRAQHYDGASGTTGPRYDEPVDKTSLESNGKPPSDVDLATELIDLKRFQVGYDANAAVIGTADRMTGELLDLLA